MTPLMPCPRCTQLLPVTAAFCRRCGAGVRPPPAASVAPAPARRGGLGIVGGLVVASGVCAAIATGFAGLRWGMSSRSRAAPTFTQVTADPPVAPSPPQIVYPLPTPSAYPPTWTRPPGYAPSHQVPPYPPDAHHDFDRRDGRSSVRR